MCRLMTPQLAEALKGFPLYSQNGKGKEAVCRAVFILALPDGSSLKEKQKDDTILFGIVIGLMEDRVWLYLD